MAEPADRLPRDRLIVALDVPTVAAARALVDTLGEAAGVHKIGHELLFDGGIALARELVADGRQVFLDLKLLDIPATMERAAANAARLGVHMLTIHGHDTASIRAAVSGRSTAPMRVLAVTVLTSQTAGDLAEQGHTGPALNLVLARARLAYAAGADGVVASGQEAAAIRAATGPEFLIVTPGVRPAGAATDDQARVMTPAAAIAAGATHVVVGRPITRAADPRAAAAAITAEIADALARVPGAAR